MQVNYHSALTKIQKLQNLKKKKNFFSVPPNTPGISCRYSTESTPLTLTNLIYRKILDFLHEFRHVEISYVCRIDNVSAYLLSKYALSIANFFVWIEENLYFIVQALP